MICQSEIRNDPISGTSEQDKKWAYEFYYNAAYELRTPYLILKGYFQPPTLAVDSDKGHAFMNWIYSPLFVPKHQDKVDGINYWTDELGKFIEDLPNLWQAAGNEDAA